MTSRFHCPALRLPDRMGRSRWKRSPGRSRKLPQFYASFCMLGSVTPLRQLALWVHDNGRALILLPQEGAR